MADFSAAGLTMDTVRVRSVLYGGCESTLCITVPDDMPSNGKLLSIMSDYKHRESSLSLADLMELRTELQRIIPGIITTLGMASIAPNKPRPGFSVTLRQRGKRKMRKADRVLHRIASYVPRRQREAWTGDLLEDVEQYREEDWTEKQLIRHIRWQLAWVLLGRVATLLKPSEWVSVFKAMFGA
jgi:hypothetical protein